MFSHAFPVPMGPRPIIFGTSLWRGVSIDTTLAILTALQANTTDCGETESKDLSSIV